jgi:hypothetical protein
LYCLLILLGCSLKGRACGANGGENLVGNPKKKKRVIGSWRRRGEDNIKTELKEMK